MIIGKVHKDSFDKNGQTHQVIRLDLRTIMFRKKMTIAINRDKWPDGDPGRQAPQKSKDGEPDYHLWANFSGRGESMPSQVVGRMDNVYDQDGKQWKYGEVYDPSFGPEGLKFRLDAIPKEAKVDKDDLYFVKWPS